MEERDFFEEKPENETHTISCPHCGKPGEYQIGWLVRRKQAQFPARRMSETAPALPRHSPIWSEQTTSLHAKMFVAASASTSPWTQFFLSSPSSRFPINLLRLCASVRNPSIHQSGKALENTRMANTLIPIEERNSNPAAGRGPRPPPPPRPSLPLPLPPVPHRGFR